MQTVEICWSYAPRAATRDRATALVATAHTFALELDPTRVRARTRSDSHEHQRLGTISRGARGYLTR